MPNEITIPILVKIDPELFSKQKARRDYKDSHDGSIILKGEYYYSTPSRDRKHDTLRNIKLSEANFKKLTGHE